jgi:hypothetical protein
VFHQFAICSAIVLVVLVRRPRIVFMRPHIYLVSLVMIVVFFWGVMLLFSQAWGDAGGLGSLVRAYRRSIRQNFFVFPDLYLPVIVVYAKTLPVLGSVLGLSVVHQVFRMGKASLASIVKNPVIPVLTVVVLIGVQPPLYFETRYTHFLYPIALCVALLSASQAAGALKHCFHKTRHAAGILAMAVCLGVFGLSEDFDAFHIFHVNAEAVSFRTGEYSRFSNHWYPRWDFERTAELVDSQASETSRVILANHVDTMAFYLEREFVFYWPRDVDDYKIVSRSGGTRELWSGKGMISSAAEVVEHTQKAESVWVVFYPAWISFDPEAWWPGRVQSVETFVPGRDERIEVWRISLLKSTGTSRRGNAGEGYRGDRK